jgi:alkylglycerol monooxygenase
MIVLLTGLSIFILFEYSFNLNVKIVFACITILTLINCGAIMEQKRWVFYMEYLRLAVVFYLPFYSTEFLFAKMVVIMLVFAILVSYHHTLSKKYYRYVLK